MSLADSFFLKTGVCDNCTFLIPHCSLFIDSHHGDKTATFAAAGTVGI